MNVYGSFPAVRMRRMRRDEFSRRLMRESVLTADDLIYPVFLMGGTRRAEEVASMPGIERMTIDRLLPWLVLVQLVSVACRLHDLEELERGRHVAGGGDVVAVGGDGLGRGGHLGGGGAVGRHF